MAALDFVKAVYFHATGVGFGTNTTAGNSLIVCICGTASNTVTSSGATFSSARASYTSAETGGLVRAYDASNITGGSTNALTVAGGGSFDGVMIEVVGQITFDSATVKHASGASGTASSGSTGTLSTSPEIGVCFIHSNVTQATAGSGWTRNASAFGVNSFAVTLEYQNVSATTALTGTSGNSMSGWDALIMTYSAGGAAAQPFVGAIANTAQSFNGSAGTSGGQRFFFMGLGGLWQPSN